MSYQSAYELDAQLPGGTVVLRGGVHPLVRGIVTGFAAVWIAWMVFGVAGVGGSDSKPPPLPFLLWIGFMVSPVVFGIYVLWTWVNVLTLNLASRTYRLEKGLRPFVQAQTGGTDHFREVECVQYRHEGHSGTREYWALTLHGNGQGRPTLTYTLENSHGVPATVEELARKMGVPFVSKPLAGKA